MSREPSFISWSPKYFVIVLLDFRIPYGTSSPTVLNIFMQYYPPQFYPANLQHFSCMYVFSIRVENSVDPDQMLCQKPSDLVLQYFQRTNLALQGKGL